MKRHSTAFPALLGLIGLLAPLSVRAAAATASRPNILIAIADDWSYGHAGAYGCTWVHTPAFDQIAREGVLFTHAYTCNAKCAPSRASIITGRNSWQLKDAANHWNYFPPEFRTFADALADAGYFTGFTGKGWAPGVALTADGKHRNLLGRPYQQRRSPPPTSGISPTDYAANFADFLAAAPANHPWCFWYGAHEPHRPYEFHSGVQKGGKSITDIDRVPAYWPDNPTIREDMLDYAFEVEHFDQHLERIIELLRSKGKLDNTLVIVTSDNGMPFPRVKGQEYDFSNHLPLAIRWPAGIPHPGRTVDDYVSFIDLAPTIIAAAGLEWDKTGMAATPGHPLQPLLASDKSGHIDPARDHVLIGKERHDVGRPHDEGYPIRGIVKDGWIYLHNFATDRWPAGNPETGYLNCDASPTKTFILQARRRKGSDVFWTLAFGRRDADELFDLQTDPECMHNLAESPTAQTRLRQMHDQLFTELKEQQDPRMFGHGDVFERYPYADPKYRDFYERFMRGEIKQTPGWVLPSDFETTPLP